MNKKALTIIGFALFLIFSIGLVGCSGEDTGNDPSETDERDATEDNEVEEGQEEADENGDRDSAGGIDLSTIDPASITEFDQSPFFDDMDLPAVEERLPDVPKVVNEFSPNELDFEVGQYGGTMKVISSQIDWTSEVFLMSNEPLINTPGITGEEFTPNIVEDFEVNDEQTEFTFYMREGLKWSDGEPVTVEDVRFAVEDVIFNKEITPVFPAWLRDQGKSDGEPMEFEVVDDYTFKMLFSEPYGGLLARIAIQGWRGYYDLLKPAHFLEQYHADYTPVEELDELIEEEGLTDGEWTELFNLKDINVNTDMTSREAIGFPVLFPWVITDYADGLYTFERNPYYFKVDPEGNQLPYVDTLESRLVEDQEMATLETIAGNVDFSLSNASLSNMPLYRENEENGGYRSLLFGSHYDPTNIYLNLTYEDETWQEVTHDVRFREALNLAIDREEAIEGIYYGFAEPSTIIDVSYDPDAANELLDEMGMEIGTDGYRQAPNGDDFRLDIEIMDDRPDYIPMTELIVEFWRDLDLNVTMQIIDAGLWGTRNEANELMATMRWTHSPLWYFDDWDAHWARSWIDWRNSGGSQGEEPPEDVKRMYDLLDELFIVPAEEALDIDQKIRDEMNEHYWFITFLEHVQDALIVNENLGNVPEEGETLAIAVNFAGEQLFYRDE